jgi:hypothetical protein
MFFCLSKGWETDWTEQDLPEDFHDVLALMGEALHDTVRTPKIAEDFDCLPEQLLAPRSTTSPATRSISVRWTVASWRKIAILATRARMVPQGEPPCGFLQGFVAFTGSFTH